MPLNHRKAPVTLTQTQTQNQNPASGMPDHAGRLEHQLLHHRLDAPALGCVTHRCIGLVQVVLSNQTQRIHPHRRQLAHQMVRVKFADKNQPGVGAKNVEQFLITKSVILGLTFWARTTFGLCC